MSDSVFCAAQACGSVTVPALPSGAQFIIPSAAYGSLRLEFDPSSAVMARPEGTDDLMFALDSGGTVTLAEFFAVEQGNLPHFLLPDGRAVHAADFVDRGILDVPTAEPVDEDAFEGSGPRYNDDAGDLVSGVDRLDSLFTDHWRPFSGAVSAVKTSAGESEQPDGSGAGAYPEPPELPWHPEGPSTEEERFIPSIAKEPDALRVHEDGLPAGTHAGEAAHATTASGSFSIESADPLASITIGGLVLTITHISAEGTLVYTISGDPSVAHGELFIRGVSLDGTVYTVDYGYALREASQAHNDNSLASGTHEELPEAIGIPVTATDASGDSAATEIILQIHDDAPSMLAPDAGLVYAGSTTVVEGALNAVWGADGAHPNSGGYFAFAGQPGADGGYPSGLESNGLPITYHVSEDGTTLTAKAGGEAVFVLALNIADGSYRLEMLGVVDAVSIENSLVLTGAHPGNSDTGGYAYLNTDPATAAIAYQEPSLEHLVAKITGGSGDAPGTINSNKECMGVNSQSFDAGEWMLLEFVKPQNKITLVSPSNRLKGMPSGEWVAYDETGAEVARGVFSFGNSTSMTIDTDNVIFHSIKLTMTEGSCGIAAVVCNSSTDTLDASASLPVAIMDADGDVCAGGIDIIFTHQEETGTPHGEAAAVPYAAVPDLPGAGMAFAIPEENLETALLLENAGQVIGRHNGVSESRSVASVAAFEESAIEGLAVYTGVEYGPGTCAVQTAVEERAAALEWDGAGSALVAGSGMEAGAKQLRFEDLFGGGAGREELATVLCGRLAAENAGEKLVVSADANNVLLRSGEQALEVRFGGAGLDAAQVAIINGGDPHEQAKVLALLLTL